MAGRLDQAVGFGIKGAEDSVATVPFRRRSLLVLFKRWLWRVRILGGLQSAGLCVYEVNLAGFDFGVPEFGALLGRSCFS